MGQAGARSASPYQALSHRLSLAHTRADSYPVSDNREQGGERTNADYSRSQLFWRATYDHSQLGDTSLLVLRTQNDKGLPPQLGTDDPDFERLTGSDRAVYAISHQFAQIPVSVKVFHSEYDFTLKSYDNADYDTVSKLERGNAQTQGLRALLTIHLALPHSPRACHIPKNNIPPLRLLRPAIAGLSITLISRQRLPIK